MDCSPQATALHRTALHTTQRFHLCEQGDRIAVGVSGGADSVALLAFLCSLRTELSLELVVCHLNHSLRGPESDADAAFVRQLAEDWGLEYRLCTFDAAAEAKAAGLGVEEYARERRYAFFQACAGPNGKIATAHTLSDAMETLLFNLIRGTGVKGLRGIPRQRENIVRPLRDCTREQVEEYLRVMGQGFRTDSTNSSDDYSRNYIRHHILPAMQQLNPALPTALERTMGQMERQWALTRQLAEEAHAALARGAYVYDREGFLRLPEPVATYLLQQWLEAAGASQSGRLLELMRRYAEAGSGGVELTTGVRFSARKAQILLHWEQPPIQPFYAALTLPKPGECVEWMTSQGKVLKISCISMENMNLAEKFNNLDFKNLADCDKIKERVFIHEPKCEDTIFLQGKRHHLFTRYRVGNRGLSNGEISRQLVVQDENGIIFAQRLGCDELRAADEHTTRAYSFEIFEHEKELSV